MCVPRSMSGASIASVASFGSLRAAGTPLAAPLARPRTRVLLSLEQVSLEQSRFQLFLPKRSLAAQAWPDITL